jgi:hypothetical protein
LGLPILNVLESLLARPSHKKNNLIPTLIIGGLVMILLFSLLTLALPPFEEPLGEDDIPSLEMGSPGELMKIFLTATIPLGLELGVLIPIRRIRVFRGTDHEKGSVDSHFKFTRTAFSILLFTAALGYRAVFLLFGSFFLPLRQSR